MRTLKTDRRGRLTSSALKEAIRKDVDKGFHPFFVCASFGSTESGVFDDLEDIGSAGRD